MKYISSILISLIIITNYCVAQSTYEISVGISNQAQIQKIFDDFYLHNTSITPRPTLYSAGDVKASDRRYDINASIIFNEKYRLQLGFSTGQISRKTSPDSTSFTNSPYLTEQYSQQITQMDLSFSKLFQYEKFIFSIGLEVPIFIMGTFEYSASDKSTLILAPSSGGSYYSYVNLDEKYTIPGGTVLGINTKVSIQYSLAKWLYVYAGGQFGLLNANLGGKSSYSYSFSHSNGIGYVNVHDNTNYNTSYISAPSMEFGIGFTFGKITTLK